MIVDIGGLLTRALVLASVWLDIVSRFFRVS